MLQLTVLLPLDLILWIRVGLTFVLNKLVIDRHEMAKFLLSPFLVKSPRHHFCALRCGPFLYLR